MREWPIDPEAFGKLSTAVSDGPDPAVKERLAEAVEQLPAGLEELVNSVVWERVSKREMARRFGVCRPEIDRQLAEAFELIREHMGWTRDAYYEAKKAKGLLQPVEEYLTEEEARASLVGRSRGDGRRLDAYALDDPVEW